MRSAAALVVHFTLFLCRSHSIFICARNCTMRACLSANGNSMSKKRDSDANFGSSLNKAVTPFVGKISIGKCSKICFMPCSNLFMDFSGAILFPLHRCSARSKLNQRIAFGIKRLLWPVNPLQTKPFLLTFYVPVQR